MEAGVAPNLGPPDDKQCGEEDGHREHSNRRQVQRQSLGAGLLQTDEPVHERARATQ